jgi:hypothetical protein
MEPAGAAPASATRRRIVMIYKFKCQATSDVIMMGPHGDHLLHLLGREPVARGAIDVADMPAAIAALQAAVEADEAARAAALASAAEDSAEPGAEAAAAPAQVPVGLRQRLWPMVEMLHRAHDAGKPVVWGV